MIDLGKIPPQATDVESSVLGAMLIDSKCIDDILAILKPESFYKEEHKKIFTAISELRKETRSIDLLTVTEKLRSLKTLDEVGGPLYVTKLTSEVASSRHSEYHARIVQDMFIKRELIRIGSELAGKAYDESNNSDELLVSHTLELNRLTCESNVENAETLENLLKERLNEIEEISKNSQLLVGVTSGLQKVDRLTGGWQKTDLIILAARPSMGKTSLALFFAMQAIRSKKPTAFFSLEMSKKQITDKAISNKVDISPSELRTGKIYDYQWEQMAFKLSGIGEELFHIDDTPALTLIQLRAKVTRLLKHGIKLVIIDYLQLMNARAKGLNRDQELGELTRGIKSLAKETNIPFIVLSQLNRSVEQRSDKRPQLSDLRESGNIEQDADIVSFIHRPERYGQTENENGSTEGLVELIFSKHRNGPVGIVNIYTNEYCSNFKDEKNEQLQPVSVRSDFYEPKNEFEDEKKTDPF